MAEQEEPDIVLAPELGKIVANNQKDFGRIAKNMERQLARLKNRLQKLKDENKKLRNDIKDANKQTEIFTEECKFKNDDMKTINENYSTKKDEQAWNKLLQEIIQRHNTLKSDLEQANYKSYGLDNMNKSWQDEIKKISENALDAANANDQNLLIEEMEARTIELETLQKVMNGDSGENELDEMLKDLQDRHNIQCGKDSSAKDDEKISDKNALKDNNNWEKLLNQIVDDYKSGNGIKWLKEINGLYLMEMEDRISDLREIKDIFEQKWIQKSADEIIQTKSKDLVSSISKRHKDTEEKVKSVLPQTNVPTKQMMNDKQINTFKTSNQNWRREMDSVVKKLFLEQY